MLAAPFGSSPEDPQAQGLELLRQLREKPHFPAVIAVAEDGNELTAVRALQLGAVDYLPKRLLTPERLKTSVLFVTHDIDEAIFLSDRVYCMTARPGTIKAEVAIPLERPRQQSMMMSSEFLALRRGLMSLIREESLKAMGGEVNDTALQGLGIDLHGQTLADVI